MLLLVQQSGKSLFSVYSSTVLYNSFVLQWKELRLPLVGSLAGLEWSGIILDNAADGARGVGADGSVVSSGSGGVAVGSAYVAACVGIRAG